MPVHPAGGVSAGGSPRGHYFFAVKATSPPCWRTSPPSGRGNRRRPRRRKSTSTVVASNKGGFGCPSCWWATATGRIWPRSVDWNASSAPRANAPRARPDGSRPTPATSLPPDQASPQRLLALWRGHWARLYAKSKKSKGRLRSGAALYAVPAGGFFTVRSSPRHLITPGCPYHPLSIVLARGVPKCVKSSWPTP